MQKRPIGDNACVDNASPAFDEISRTLFDAWTAGPDDATAQRLLVELPVPGSVALRGRFMFLTDPQPRFAADAFELEWDTWTQQIALTDTGDAALLAGDLDAARASFSALATSHRRHRHPLPLVDALLGLGEAARNSDDFDRAAELLHESRSVAVACSYRFGVMRATLSLGYLTLHKGSVDDALSLFAEAERVAEELDDRVLRAGAFVGAGEAHDKAGRRAEAIAAVERAVEIFEQLRSHAGVVNASLILGDLYRRERDVSRSRAAFERALKLAEEHGPWVATVNALDGLAEAHLALGDLEAARARYAQAYDRSQSRDYTRGMAHATNGLGRVMFAASELESAVEMHSAAADLFALVDDSWSQASALTGRADAYEMMGRLQDAIESRLDAVGCIERVRAAQDRHRPQEEFLERFAAVYRAALRTAHAAQRCDAFVAVFEALAGRRLAGLLEATDTAAADAAFAGQMLSFAATRPPTNDDVSREEKIARLLGRTALRGHLPEAVQQGIDDLVAAAYTAFDPAHAPTIIDKLGGKTFMALCVLPGRDNEVMALVGIGTEPVAIKSWRLPDETVALVRTLASHGLPPEARLVDIDPLRHLLPPGTDLGSRELLIVAIDPLWAVPWPALDTGGGLVLGEQHAITLAPSLTLAVQPPRPHPKGSTVAAWRSPHVKHIQLHAFTEDKRIDFKALDHAVDTKDRILDGAVDTLVLVAHGVPAPGVRHFLELDTDVYVTPLDLIGANVPRRLALIACWSAHTPEGQRGEPLTLATIAAMRGAQVICTVSELADDRLASTFINNVLHDSIATDFATAIHTATVSYLQAPSRRAGFLSRWAPLITVGA